MHRVKLKDDGSLDDVYNPAIYLDTNFLRHYFLAEGSEEFVDDSGNEVEPSWAKNFPKTSSPDSNRRQYLWELVQKGSPSRDFALMRRYATHCLTKASLILTPIAVLELFKLHAEVAFKDISADALGVKTVQRWGDKAVGECLTEIFNRSITDPPDKEAQDIKQDCTFNLSFAQAHGLWGTFYVNDLRFRITEGDVGGILWVPSFLQLDAADILHMHAAHCLKCDYFASLDKGFSRNRNLIEGFAHFKLLCSVQEVMAVMKEHRKTDAQPPSAGDFQPARRGSRTPEK